MTVEFLRKARIEWLEAIEYYNQERAALGFEFALEVDRTVSRIVQFPEAWARVGPRTRRALLDRFPYGLLYTLKPDRIVITAVMNLRRKPETLQ
ncbi:MAG: type II toxin-antitoxin system RelE/ParE family toxin [Spirochaetaceae bacterium]|nr:MAG: type II toxin-antitoxin system RelE/ParE family toxin [Spirochaetaceae bacterium]